MPVSQYPTPFDAAYPTEPSGPIISIFQDLPVEYRGTIIKEFKDGGANFGESTANPTLRWLIKHVGLYVAETAVLDAHWIEARGLFSGFSFRHPRTDVLYSDVHYESYNYPEHRKIYMQERTTILIKRPTG